MSIRVLLRDYPHRAIALVTASHALIFHHSPSVPSPISSATVPHCVVEFTALPTIGLREYHTLSPSPIHGTLGLITIAHDVFLCVVTGASVVAVVRPGETVERIHGVQFYCLNNSAWDFGADIADEEDDGFNGQLRARESLLEHPCTELLKLLRNGSFYFSTDFDLTKRIQNRATDCSSLDADNLDDSFLWNSYMISPLVKFRSGLVAHEREALDNSRIITSAIRGFVLTITIPSSSAPLRTTSTGLPSSLTLISRLSCRRAGTRFNSRGIDDDGKVANFVESETIYWSPIALAPADCMMEKSAGMCFSYSQVRGSVPVFWEQAAGLLPGQQKISITRSPEGTQPAFNKHFNELEQNYGAVHIINLLSETKPGEAELTNLYRTAVRKTTLNRPGYKNTNDHQFLKETEFDFHAETKGPHGYEAASLIRRLIQHSADGFAYYLSEDVVDSNEQMQEKSSKRTIVVLLQEGVFRTNCLDCLDRTNLIQTIISQMAMESFLSHRGKRAASDFWMRHSSLWADNGDALSRIYAGTGALKTSFTRHGKMSLAGAIADARKSATRLYINNFADKARQNTIDLLLGRLVGQTAVHLFDPASDFVSAELAERRSEFQSSKTIKIWCGTFNLNGRMTGVEEDLSSWLCPGLDPAQQTPEIFAVGFQEIVELSPQQIMNSDPTRKQAWERAVKKTLNKQADASGGGRYVLLRSGQLVGAALMIFVKKSVLSNIRNVEGSVKKTGLSGMAGNKGAVAIRMDYANTPLCFVTAHLAAGFANYEERNRDYSVIHHGLRFQRNRGVDDHETVIWMGDFNYRIGLGIEKVKQLIRMGDWDTLYENDQLNLQMVAGLTFPYYSEARITFPPTYKFDVGEDTYDTSDNARIPAWTDRILWKGSNIRQVRYSTAPHRFSDHRPVYATFLCTVSIIDTARREALSREIYEKWRSQTKASACQPPLKQANLLEDDTDSEDLLGYEAIEPGLPPASSDRRKWWLDNGASARSSVRAPEEDMLPNPRRELNPWRETEESDWVTVTRIARNTPPPKTKAMAPTLPPPRATHAVAPHGNEGGNMTRKFAPAYLYHNIDDNAVDEASSRAPIFASTRIPDTHSQTFENDQKKAADRKLFAANPSGLVPASGAILGAKKTPPPIAKKPVHLVSSPSSGSGAPLVLSSVSDLDSRTATIGGGWSGNGNASVNETETGGFGLPVRTSSPGNNPGHTANPSLVPGLRRSGGRGRQGKDIETKEAVQPELPPRRPIMGFDLLDSENGSIGGVGLSGWEALRPS